jgi:hypothetical protein
MTHKTHHGHHTHHAHAAHHPVAAKRGTHFSKTFRWQTEKPGPQPVKVELVGTFTGWHKVPLRFDRPNGVWQLTQHDIPGNRTHNYMLLVNGRPTKDKNCDGLAVPHTDEEKHFALSTPRGPRVFMLFSNTK